MHGALCIHIHLQMYKCTDKDSLYTPIPAPPLRVIDFMLSGPSLLCSAPSDRLAAVRIEGIKGEVTVMSKAACFPLSQLRTSTSAGCMGMA